MRRRGRAPPADPFTGEDPEVRLEDWIPSLRRVADWNEWSEEELLLQLAGHLRGRALQEWNLLDEHDKARWETTVQVLGNRLDPGSRVLAAQDFRHMSQGTTESVADFVRRLERTFNVAYGRDHMSLETRETFLHSQLQEGLRYGCVRFTDIQGAVPRSQERGESRLKPGEQGVLKELLQEYHDAFSLEPHERGETDLVQFKIETGDATPRSNPTADAIWSQEGSSPTAEGDAGIWCHSAFQ